MILLFLDDYEDDYDDDDDDDNDDDFDDNDDDIAKTHKKVHEIGHSSGNMGETCIISPKNAKNVAILARNRRGIEILPKSPRDGSIGCVV